MNLKCQFYNDIKMDILNQTKKNGNWANNKAFLRIVKYSFIGLLVVFNINNFFKYSPTWGFDGKAHMYLVKYVAQYWQFPKEWVYGVSNPPLYYFVAAFIYNLFKIHSFKIVQFLSLVIYVADLLLLSSSLRKLMANEWLHLAIVVFFALLPVHLHSAYMIYNYGLSNFFALVLFYLMLYFYQKEKVEIAAYVWIGACAVAGVLTSLTGIAYIACSIVYFLFIPSLSFKKKAIRTSILLLVMALLLYPYYEYKTKTFGSFFKITHRTASNVKALEFYKVYPLGFYFNFEMKAFKEPYITDEFRDPAYRNQHLNWGAWTILHETLYGDYFNYQVDATSSDEGKDRTGLIHTGRHYISPQRARLLTVLNFVGVSISVLFLFVVMRWLLNSGLFFILRRKDLFIDMIFLVTLVLIFSQFFVYMLEYPDYVNISSAYIFPGIFLLSLGLARFLKHRWAVYLTVVLLLLYSATSYYTFWKK